MTTFLLTLKKQMIMGTEQMKQHQAPATHTPAGNKMTYTPPQTVSYTHLTLPTT